LDKKIGDTVNLENDVIGKYVERLISQNSQKEDEHKSNIDMAFLAKCGF
jgi:riboflavin synthase